MVKDRSLNLFFQPPDEKRKKLGTAQKKSDNANAPTPQKIASSPKSFPNLTEMRPRSKIPTEFQAMFDQMRNMHKEIEEKIRTIQTMTGRSPEEIQVYGSNPNNFSPEQWKSLQAKKEAIEGKLLAFLGNAVPINKQKYIDKEVGQKKINDQTKNRKSKIVAARKKNWISMR